MSFLISVRYTINTLFKKKNNEISPLSILSNTFFLSTETISGRVKVAVSRIRSSDLLAV